MLFLEEFWNGNIAPGEGRYHSKKEYKDAWRLVEQTEDELKERLTAEDCFLMKSKVDFSLSISTALITKGMPKPAE